MSNSGITTIHPVTLAPVNARLPDPTTDSRIVTDAGAPVRSVPRTVRACCPTDVLDGTVNGVEKQRSNTRHMLFKVPLLIADISAAMTLEPGDIIATGTPEGVGAGRSPQEWLWPGDIVEAEVTGIGRLRHPVVAI